MPGPANSSGKVALPPSSHGSPGSAARPSTGRSGVRRSGSAGRWPRLTESCSTFARGNPTDGTRIVAALASRDLGAAVNRKRVQRLMREHALLQPKRSEARRRRPGYFQVTQPDELWHLDMTGSLSTAGAT